MVLRRQSGSRNFSKSSSTFSKYGSSFIYRWECRVSSRSLKSQSIWEVMRLKFIRKCVRMVAYTHQLGESSVSILIALNGSDFMVVKIIAKFWAILHVTGRLWFQMIHNHHQKTRFRSLTDRLCCIVVKEIKILFNLVYYFYVKKKKGINNKK